MPLTTTADVPASVDAYYDRLLLMRALPALVHARFAQLRPIPSGKGTKVIRFRRFNALAKKTDELIEGITPTGKKLSSSDITATLKFYGDYVEITDEVDMLSEDPILTEADELLGEQAGLSLDTIIRDNLVAGTSVLYSGSATTRNDVVALADGEDFDRAVRLLQNNNAKVLTPSMRATSGVGTKIVRRAYWAIIHPDVLFTLDDITGWIDVSEYTADAVEDEVGSYRNVRFIMSTEAKVFLGEGATSGAVKNTAGEVDVYATLIFAANAYGTINFAGKALRNIRKSFAEAGGPLEQRATSGWKANLAVKILNDNFMLRLESAASL